MEKIFNLFRRNKKSEVHLRLCVICKNEERMMKLTSEQAAEYDAAPADIKPIAHTLCIYARDEAEKRKLAKVAKKFKKRMAQKQLMLDVLAMNEEGKIPFIQHWRRRVHLAKARPNGWFLTRRKKTPNGR